ncbi:ABC transporter permease [Patescibacteria group bacterium]|jgi:ABC-2 type transport system permease protein|nr:ABC transporter permease [Patescibacteria group bacterium]
MSDFQRSILIPLYTLTHQEVKRFMRVPLQVLASPWISALLYIFIFGFVIGSQIEEVQGIPYLDFILPGLMLMQLMTAAFMEGSSGLYFKRFIKTIEEVLVAPIPNWMVIVSFLIAGIIRGLIVALGILAVAFVFSSTPLHNIPLLLGWASAVAIIFTLAGMVVGLWAKTFEQLNVFNVFLIMPLTYLGGVFYSIAMLPEGVRWIVQLNPFFYFIDGIRYSMTGISESHLLFGAGLITALIAALFALVWWLFRIGYGIRE